MANKRNFPTIKPSSRTFTPGRYPQTEFVAQNGAKTVLFDKVRASDGRGKLLLRYRFDGPPTVTSVRPNRSNVQCKFVACLDGD